MKLELHPIRTEADYRPALARAEKFFDAVDEPVPDSPEGSYFDALVTLIQAYEARHYPVAPPTPVDAIKFRMEQGGLSVNDMVPYIGPRHRVYEVLNGMRSVAMHMIRRLVKLGIPAASLIRQPEPAVV